MSESPRLRITEIFHSIQGESVTAGCLTVFVRLTGCPLRCGYCDTEYAFQGGEWMTLEAILEQAGGYGTKYVTVTGGEPLAQPNCLPLLAQLCDRGYRVSLETSGALLRAGPGSPVRLLGFVGDGTITLNAAGADPGDAVEGSFEGIFLQTRAARL